MILVLLILIPLAGGLIAWAAGGREQHAPRWVALAATSLNFILTLLLWIEHPPSMAFTGSIHWIEEIRLRWIPQLGISVHLGLDGLSLLMVLLTNFLGILCVLTSWTEITNRVGFFHFNLLWILSGILGVFLSLDLFLFYFFWELMLVPMFFLIGIWGHERRVYAAIKFFLFTQLSGLLMLLAILGLYFVHHHNTGVYTFDYMDLLGTKLSPTAGMLLLLGFLAAFAVKIPLVPVHTWLPDAHTEAPTAGSVILAGLLLKTGAYGLIRFVVPLFPQAAHAIGPYAMILGVVGILYGAILAFAQRDLKRLVAYTSISHLGFVVLGVFAWSRLALQGAVMQMICHGISTGALFILVGGLQERAHTRDMNRLGGLWGTVPKMGTAAMLFAMASLGLPGLGNFVGEFLVLVGSYAAHPVLTILATCGLVAATVYSLWIIQQVFHGKKREDWRIADLTGREVFILASLTAAILWLGLYPRPVLRTAEPALDGMQTVVAQITQSQGGTP